MLTRPIEQLLIELETYYTHNPTALKALQTDLSKTLRSIYSQAISNPDGYCMTLKVPEHFVKSLPPRMGFTDDRIRNAFCEEWEVDKSAPMKANSYYHILTLLIGFGVRQNLPEIQKCCLAMLLCKIWNGRRMHFIQYCNPDIMRYVISNLNGKYLSRKHESPMSLIIDHFVPTILDKYAPEIKKDSYKLKRLFEQTWGRIYQIFISNKRPNLLTKETKGTSGLAPLYYEAKEKGLSIKKTTMTGKEDDANVLDSYSSHEFDDIITGITNYIVMNINPHYDSEFINYISRTSTVNLKATEIILKAIHNNKYIDWIRDILELMFRQMQVTSKSEICNRDTFMTLIRKKFISSKHSPNITQLKKIIDELLENIFDDAVKYVSYSSYSTPRQGHLRKVIFYGFAHNIQKYMCMVHQ